MNTKRLILLFMFALTTGLIFAQYPLLPQNQQHDIGGTIGEERGSLPRTRYHYGLDMFTTNGTLAYSIESGTYNPVGDAVAAPEFNRLAFLSDSTVMVRFVEQTMDYDTILPYSVNQGITSIKLGPSPEEALVLYKGSVENSLVCGVVSTYYSFQLPNGMVDYSPLIIDFTTEQNPLNILNQLRMDENLMAGDTVGVNLSGYLFE